MSSEVQVRGNASPEELAAVLAVVARGQSTARPPDPFTQWRSTRLAALRRNQPGATPGWPR
jgi:hypothetical protein